MSFNPLKLPPENDIEVLAIHAAAMMEKYRLACFSVRLGENGYAEYEVVNEAAGQLVHKEDHELYRAVAERRVMELERALADCLSVFVPIDGRTIMVSDERVEAWEAVLKR